MSNEEIKTKVCTTCKKRKTKDLFGKKSGTKDGLRYYCKKCNAVLIANYRATGKTIANKYSNKSKKALLLEITHVNNELRDYGYVAVIKELSNEQ